MQKDKWKITRKYHSTDLSKKSFLITGGAGFIGSNLAQYLLDFGAEKVRILDDLSNGYLKNLEPYKNDSRLEFIEGESDEVYQPQKYIKTEQNSVFDLNCAQNG